MTRTRDNKPGSKTCRVPSEPDVDVDVFRIFLQLHINILIKIDKYSVQKLEVNKKTITSNVLGEKTN